MFFSWLLKKKISLDTNKKAHPSHDHLKGGLFSSWIIPGAIFIIGTLISLGLAITFRIHEKNKIETNFYLTSNNYFKAIEHDIDNFISDLKQVQTLFFISDNISREKFLIFTAPMMERDISFQAISWSPILKYNELKKFENQARHDALRNFYFFEIDKKDNKIPVQKRDQYIPVYYIEPRQKNLALLGFDNSFKPEDMAYFEKAAKTGQAITSERLTLLQDVAIGKKSYGAVIYLPVYDSDRKIKSYVTGTMRIGDLVKNAIFLVKAYPVNIYLFDLDAKNPEDNFLFFYNAEASENTLPHYTSLHALTHSDFLTMKNILTVGNKRWALVTQATPELMAYSWLAELIFIIGLVFSFIAADLIRYIIEYDKVSYLVNKLEHLVAKRTIELKIANTHLTQSLENLKKTQAQLVQSEKMASLGSLTAGIAHEINNPVNFSMNSINPVEKDVAQMAAALHKLFLLDPEKSKKIKTELNLEMLLDEVKTNIASMREGLNRTITIVKDLGIFSRKDENAPKRTDIHAGIDSTLNILASTFGDRIKIIKKYGDIPQIECFPGKLNQVFMNLLTNAATAIKSIGEIHISTEIKDDKLKITFKDTGIGIPKENLNRIFEPFFTTAEPGKGMGMGLSISYGIIAEHHGTIDAKSEFGQGSEFIITLPITQNTTT